jgi:large subunit ribosomal protein L23
VSRRYDRPIPDPHATAKLRVNIINMPAKHTRRAKSRRLAIRTATFKKAIVTLTPESRIPFFEGV